MMRASRDVRTLSEFRANAAAFVEQVRSTNEPIFITRRGRTAAVLVDIRAYESLLDDVGVLQDARLAEQQADLENVRPRELTEIRLRAMLGR
jgi:prevent-host-death family protein